MPQATTCRNRVVLARRVKKHDMVFSRHRWHLFVALDARCKSHPSCHSCSSSESQLRIGLTWPSALMAMSDLVSLLTRSPSLFGLDEGDVHLVENSMYAGIYFSLVTDAGIRLHCHATIGHWQHEPAAKLSDRSRDRILTRFEESLKKAFASQYQPVFSNSDALQLNSRIISTLHVRGSLSNAMWSLQQTVQEELQTEERSRRVNYHISVDSVSQRTTNLEEMD